MRVRPPARHHALRPADARTFTYPADYGYAPEVVGTAPLVRCFDAADASDTLRVFRAAVPETASRDYPPNNSGRGHLPHHRRRHRPHRRPGREHPTGLVLTLPRSKTNPIGEHVELAVLPRAGNADGAPSSPLERLAAPRRHRRRAPLPPGREEQPGHRSPAASRNHQHPGAAGRRPRRLRHLRPRARRLRPGHRPPDPATAPWPPWAATSAFSRPGPTTPPPVSGCSRRAPCPPYHPRRRSRRRGSRTLMKLWPCLE